MPAENQWVGEVNACKQTISFIRQTMVTLSEIL